MKHDTTEVLPFHWLCENRTLGIICRKEETRVPYPLFEALTKMFRTNLPMGVEIKELQGKLVPLNVAAKGSVYLGCDVAAFTCHKISAVTPPQYLVSLNAPLQIHNYLQRPLEISV